MIELYSTLLTSFEGTLGPIALIMLGLAVFDWCVLTRCRAPLYVPEEVPFLSFRLL